MKRRIVLATAGILACLPPSLAAARFRWVGNVRATEAPSVAMARTADRSLHLVFQTLAPGTSVATGLSAVSISARGVPSAPMMALSGWNPGQPGLVAPAGAGGGIGVDSLVAVFGGTRPPATTGVFAIVQRAGSSNWSAPGGVLGGGPNESLAWASNVTAAMSGPTPVLALPQAGNIVIQRGVGPGSPSYQLNSSFDGSTTDAELGTDAASQAVVAGWGSVAGSQVRDYLQQAAPAVGTPQAVPGLYRNVLQMTGRDRGAGVFAPYTTDGARVGLLRYGARRGVAVGSLRRLTANRLGVATGIGGRIWVLWGNDGGVAVTRSNRAVTRFEPAQRLNPGLAILARVAGDGRLGPLDLIVVGARSRGGRLLPSAAYYARVLPRLSVRARAQGIRNKLGKVIAVGVVLTVTDAGDRVRGAVVGTGPQTRKTNVLGRVRFTLPPTPEARFTITARGYQVLRLSVRVR